MSWYIRRGSASVVSKQERERRTTQATIPIVWRDCVPKQEHTQVIIVSRNLLKGKKKKNVSNYIRSKTMRLLHDSLSSLFVAAIWSICHYHAAWAFSVVDGPARFPASLSKKYGGQSTTTVTTTTTTTNPPPTS